MRTLSCAKIFFAICIACVTVCKSYGQKSDANNNAQSLPIPKLSFDSNGDLLIAPSATSSAGDFDFFEGKWNLHNKLYKIKTDGTKDWQEFEATQEMHKFLMGKGNVDNFIAVRNGKPFEGMTVRVFNPKTRLWSIYWADSNFGVLGMPSMVGSFENKVGHFFSKEVDNGKTVITVFRWDARDPNHPVWSQATSNDNGATWNEWNWTMYFKR